MTRFLVFAGEQYYPLGGWDDLKDSYDLVREAQEALPTYVSQYDWVDVVDTKHGEVCYGFDRSSKPPFVLDRLMGLYA